MIHYALSTCASRVLNSETLFISRDRSFSYVIITNHFKNFFQTTVLLIERSNQLSC